MSVLSNWSVTQAETEFEFSEARMWMENNWGYSIIISALYIVCLFGGQTIMTRFEAIKFRKVLFTWNLCLAVFSFTALRKLHGEFTGSVQHNGLRGSYCKTTNYYAGNVGYWVWLFHLSKLLELGDTAFLVLRKRPVIFLHWFHHSTVLVCSWYVYPYSAASIRWGTWMNLVVHSIMYSYFALSSLGFRMPRGLSMGITTLQISQFAIGMCVCGDVFIQVMILGNPCEVPPNVAIWQSVLYGSYLLIFSQFFHKTYLASKSTKQMKVE